MATEEGNKNKVIESTGDPKIDAIKQLIFGENMTEYDQRFDDVIRQLDALKSDSDNKKSELDQKISDEIASMKTHFENKMTAMENAFLEQVGKLEDKKADRKALGKMFQNIAEKLQA